MQSLSRSTPRRSRCLTVAFILLTAKIFAGGELDDAKNFATELASLKTPVEQDARMAAADPRMLAGQNLRDALAKIETERAFAGDYLAAESIGRLIIRFSEKRQDAEGVAIGQTLLSGMLRELGEYEEALALLEPAHAYFEKHQEDFHGLVSTEQALGIVYLYQCNYLRALASLNRGLQLSEKINYREGIIPALNSIGNVYRDEGQQQRALEYYERARAVVGNDSAWNMAFIFNNIGQSYESLGQYDKALDFIQKARAVAEKVKFRPRVATSLAVLGNLKLKEAKFADAQNFYQQSLELSRELSDPAGQARAILGQAEAFRQAGDFEKSLAHSETAAVIYRKTGQLAQIAAARTLSGGCLRALQRNDDAQSAFEEAIAAIEQIRGQIAGGEAEAEAFFDNHIQPYQEMVALFAEKNEPEKALAMAERASARQLLDIVAGGRSERSNELSDAEKNREQELNLQAAQLNRELSRARTSEKPDDSKIAALEKDLQQARSAREEFEINLGAAHPQLRKTAPPQPLQSVREIAPLLADGKTALLKFALTDQRAFLIVIRTEEGAHEPAVHLISLPLDRAEARTRAQNFRSALASRGLGWQKNAREIYERLLRPAEQFFRGAHELVVIPDGPLWELPFQTLLDENGQSLLENFAVSYAPSVTLFGRSSKTEPTKIETLIAFANPSLGERATHLPDADLSSGNWRPLPEAEKQTRALEKLYPAPESRVFIGADAREDIAKREAPRADLLHFATHGVLNDRAPLYSYLLMAQTDLAPGDDGLLEAWELMRLNLHARLAVLSACETARGRTSAGEGLIGFSWALQVAGCPDTVVSQWKVDSESSSALMVNFYKKFRGGNSPAEALRQAALSLGREQKYRHPFYWAPFIVVGAAR